MSHSIVLVRPASHEFDLSVTRLQTIRNRRHLFSDHDVALAETRWHVASAAPTLFDEQWQEMEEAQDEMLAAADRLKPCPFCGQKPGIEFFPVGEFAPEINDEYWAVGCSHAPDFACDIDPMAFGPTLQDVIQLWNTRAHLPTDH